MTINEAMALEKIVRERLSELRDLRSKVAVKSETHWFGREPSSDKKESIEPQFDVKTVDKKVVQLENFLFKISASIKQANARTDIGFEANVDELLAPLA